MDDLQDIKLSLIEAAKARLADDIEENNFLPHPPAGDYTPPIFYLSFREKRRSGDSYACLIRHDYLFDVVVQVPEGETDDKDKSRMVAAAFIQNEALDFYHFSGSLQEAREGKLLVSRYILREGDKDRQRNKIKAELIVTY